MATTSQDTGGLGLLQQLMQTGFPPQLLLQLLMQGPLSQTPRSETSDAPGPPSGTPSGTPGGESPGVPSFAEVSDPGATVTGTGGQSNPGATFLSGMRNGGLLGQAAQAVGLPTQAGNVAAKGLGLGASLIGAPSGIVSLLNSLFGGSAALANEALRVNGQQVAPLTFGGPKTVNFTRGSVPQSLSDTVRGQTGPTGGGPSSTPGTVGLPGVPSMDISLNAAPAPAPTVDLTLADLSPVDQAVIDAIDAAANAEGEPSGGPGGANSGISDSSGGQSGSPAGDASSSGEGDN